MVELRGNVDTRLRKLAEGELAGIVLAVAGLRRLGRDDEIAFRFGADEMVPAPGQGSLALQARAGDAEAAAAAARDLRPRRAGRVHRRAGGDRGARRHVRDAGRDLRAPHGRDARAWPGSPGFRTGRSGCATRSAATPSSPRRSARRSRRGCSRQGRATSSSGRRSRRRVNARPGVVYLVGAGPGDPGLMTARSLELIASADVDPLRPPDPGRGARGRAGGRRAALRRQGTRRVVGAPGPDPRGAGRAGPRGLIRRAPQGRRPVRVRARGRGGRGAQRRGHPVRGRARRHRRRGRARLRGNPGHPPRRRVGRRLRHRARGPGQGRDRARLGGAGALPGDARPLHGSQEPARDRAAARGRRA